jgi:4-amino-4-deoxy-L-arabinose transferase-like glycosyltransferase
MFSKKKLILGLLIVLFLCGFFLRIFRIDDYTTFLGDQGRDALVIRDIITLHHFPAIGAPTSIGSKVGSIFLGPFYYYLVAPFQLLYWNNPLGSAVFVALLNGLSIIGLYFMTKKFYGRSSGLIASFFAAFCIVMINYSRFSWNPNPLPFFSFLSFYFLLRAVEKRQSADFILWGLMTGLAVQLHYLYLSIIAAYIFIVIALFIKKKWGLEDLKKVIFSGVSFVVAISPLIIFDLKHQFLNIKAFIALFTDKSTGGYVAADSNFFSKFLDTVYTFIQYIAGFKVSALEAWVMIALLVIGVVLYTKRKLTWPLGILLFTLFVSFAITALYQGAKFEHYYMSIYYLFFVLIGISLSGFIKQFHKISVLLICILLFGYLYINVSQVDFLTREPSRQIMTAQVLAKVIHDNVSNDKYRLAMIPAYNADTTVRYFLTTLDQGPLAKDSLEKAQELYIICESKCSPTDDAQWDIAYFGPNKKLGEWKIDRYTIYKYEH